MTLEPSRAVELRLRAAVESSPSGLLMIDADGKILLVNREVERLFGYAREEMLGRHVDMLVPERFQQSHPEYRKAFFADPKVRSMGVGRDLFGRRKDGMEVPVEIGLTPVATDEGLFVISSIVDISARKQAEERFRLAVEASPNGMVMVDAAGRIVLVNREVERIFGYSRDELLGQSIEMLVPERFRGEHPGFRQAFHSAPEVRTMGAGRDLFGLHKDGKEIPVEIGLNPIETDEGLFVLSSIVDISARKHAEAGRRELEEQLRQSQKMEAIGRLAGGIAHDFNNILAAIVGYADLASQASSIADTQHDLAEVLNSAGRGKELVERILRFSRRGETAVEPIDLGSRAAESARLLRATLPAAVEIRLRKGEGVPPVMSDATSVEQVLMNLATNAAHAMPQGGVIDIEIERFYARDSLARAHPGLHEGHYVLLRVKDTGHGMDPGTLQRAFEPFFTTKPSGSGSGLGLSIVHGVMRDSGGTVWIESEVGTGTSVNCLFPSVETEAQQAERQDSVVPRGQGERILYVDDEPALAEVSRRILESLGYSVLASTSPTDALELFRTSADEFDLVITDYSMPKMSGLDLAREISAQRPGIPIVLLSGYVEEFPPASVTAAGVLLVARKPLTMQSLGEMVHQAIETGRG